MFIQRLSLTQQNRLLLLTHSLLQGFGCVSMQLRCFKISAAILYFERRRNQHWLEFLSEYSFHSAEKCNVLRMSCVHLIDGLREAVPFSIRNGYKSFYIHTFRNHNGSSERPKSGEISRLALLGGGGQSSNVSTAITFERSDGLT